MTPDLSPTLSNSKVILRPLTAGDDVTLHFMAEDTAAWKYGTANLSVPGELEKYIANAVNEHEAGTCAPFVIIDAASGKVAGTTRIAEISWKYESGHMGWTFISEEFRGTGLNKVIKFEMLRYAFETLKLNRVHIQADERNVRSCRAIAGIGAKPEGVIRQHIKLWDGHMRNSAIFSILKSEWPDSPLHDLGF